MIKKSCEICGKAVNKEKIIEKFYKRGFHKNIYISYQEKTIRLELIAKIIKWHDDDIELCVQCLLDAVKKALI
jgi:hypothetical protein